MGTGTRIDNPPHDFVAFEIPISPCNQRVPWINRVIAVHVGWSWSYGSPAKSSSVPQETILSLLGKNVLFSFRDELNSLRRKLTKTIEVFTQQVEIANTMANRMVVAGEIKKDLVSGGEAIRGLCP